MLKRAPCEHLGCGGNPVRCMKTYLRWLLERRVQAVEMKRQTASVAQKELSTFLASLTNLLVKVWECLSDKQEQLVELSQLRAA